jgi:hypothetical protein
MEKILTILVQKQICYHMQGKNTTPARDPGRIRLSFRADLPRDLH